MMIMVVALALAAATALGTFRYVSAADERALGDAELVEVFMVKKDVAKGLPGERAVEDGYIEKERIPRKYSPAKALVDIQSLRGKVALGALAAGLPVVEGSFVEPRVARESFAQRIDSGHQAVTLSLNDVQGVARLVVPGDRVNILFNDSTGAEPSTGFVLQGVEVLAVGNSAEALPGEAAPVAPEGAAGTVTTFESGLITFSLPAFDAERVVHASLTGTIHLTLVPPDFQPAPIAPVTRGNLFS